VHQRLSDRRTSLPLRLRGEEVSPVFLTVTSTSAMLFAWYIKDAYF